MGATTPATLFATLAGQHQSLMSSGASGGSSAAAAHELLMRWRSPLLNPLAALFAAQQAINNNVNNSAFSGMHLEHSLTCRASFDG